MLKTKRTGEPYFTDGLRAAIILDAGITSLKQIKNIGWESPTAFSFDTLGAD
jgi:hypothetical protein